MTANYLPTRFMAEGSRYDQRKADFAVAFIQALRHTKGRWAGKPFTLLPWQERIVRDLFGTIKEDGYRQFTTAYVEIPKKMGKQVALDTLISTLRVSRRWVRSVSGMRCSTRSAGCAA